MHRKIHIGSAFIVQIQAMIKKENLKLTHPIMASVDPNKIGQKLFFKKIMVFKSKSKLNPTTNAVKSINKAQKPNNVIFHGNSSVCVMYVFAKSLFFTVLFT
jgi:hypothetical protein